MSNNQRELTSDEQNLIPFCFDDPYFSLDDNQVHATWKGRHLTSATGDVPWIYQDNQEALTLTELQEEFPGSKELDFVDWTNLTGEYQGKHVKWSSSRYCWKYGNNREVDFSEPPPSDLPNTPIDSESSDSDQAEVSQILESTTQTVTALITRVSRPQTPQTPRTPQTPLTFPGALPTTPGPSTPRVYPTPSSATLLRVPSQPQAPPPAPPSPSKTPATVPVTTQAVPATTTPTTSTTMTSTAPPPKILGSPPEPFDGKPNKAEAFWSSLANYYYLNESSYTNEGKWVSAALTHFKIGTPAGDWAQDKQKTALAATPIDFGTWAAFGADFKKHFIPAHSALEATNAMYTSRMGTRPFNEWYQDWSTYATRSGANEETKMFAFRKAIPGALHQKIMGVSPQPTTLDGLVEKAREFDRIWHLYSNPAFTGGGRKQHDTRSRAIVADSDDAQVNATTATRPKMGKLSKEEKDRRYKEKLCFYCGKPNHTAKECRTKTLQTNQGGNKPGNQRPRTDFKARATTTQEESYEETPEEHPAQISAMYQNPRPQFMIPRPHSAPINEDF